MIKLLNGKEVSVDEFVTWSKIKQTRNLVPQNYSAETKAKMAEARLVAAQKKALKAQTKASVIKGIAHWKRTTTPLGSFLSLKAAAAAHRVGTDVIKRLIKTKSDEYYYVGVDGARLPVQKARTNKKDPVVTPNGQFVSVASAAEAYNVSTGTIRNWIKKKQDQFYRATIPSKLG